jgi:NADPH-dependent curcumin reductase CurA
MASNNTLVFKKIPDGLPISGEHLVVEDRPIDLDNVPSGGLVMEVHSASLDPYLRTRMRDPEVPSFMTAFKINDPIVNGCVGTVLKSSTPDFVKGDLIYVPFLPLAQYACVSAEDIKTAQKIDNPFNLPLENFVGPLGMPGLTAYSSLYEIGKPQKGETIFVSSAAGAVGSLVGQLAKREGLRVIGSVGSDEKLDFILNDLGFDAGFNYKKESPSNALKRLAPDGIHIYFENVGGKHLEAAIESLKDRGRVIVCGMVSCFLCFLDAQ